MGEAELFPRELTPIERELLLWLLPEDRPGYSEYRTLFAQWMVAARGRRGEGNYIIAAPTERPDNESPLPQLLAHGVVETRGGRISISIRERLGDQVEFEIMYPQLNKVFSVENELHRWTYSYWLPSQGCPACKNSLREVAMNTTAGQRFVLAVCSNDKLLWVYDEATKVNHPIPTTNFYNELMLHNNTRDPKIALDSKRLFTDLAMYPDRDLVLAFVTYNKLRAKIPLNQPIVVPEESQLSFFKRITGLFFPTNIL
ncbi:MAG: hypothetical protein HY088_06360 [Ignavibacteriales bacterium]|nr:hypothetical protein [Ignavibacteriales bacterium]